MSRNEPFHPSSRRLSWRHFAFGSIAIPVLACSGFSLAPFEALASTVPPAESRSTEESSGLWIKLRQILAGRPELPQKPEADEPLMIIASRLPEFKISFDQTPANVSYKSKDDLGLTHPKTFQEAVRDLEGAVFFDEVGNGVDETFSLRGFSDSSAVIFLLDGVRINELDGDVVNFPLISMNDIHSLQVDRGSASPVYGSGAFAGVVHLTTGQPSEKPLSVFGGLEWSSFQGIRFHQGFSGTLQDRWTPLAGKLSYYFDGGRHTSEGFRKNGSYRITSFDIKSAYTLQEEIARFTVGIKHMDNNISNPGEMTFEQFQEDFFGTNKMLDGRAFRQTIVQLGADAKFWSERLKAALLASWRLNHIVLFSTSGTFIDFATFADPNTDRVRTKSRNQDLIWTFAYEDKWGWFHNHSLIGMEIRDGLETSIRQEAFEGVVNGDLFPETDRKSEPSNVSLFWRETIRLFEKIIPFVGMRYDKYRLKTQDFLDADNDLKIRWDNASWSTGVTVKPVEPVDLFFNYSQGFRVPTISELAPFDEGVNRELDPERTDSFEMGSRVHYKEMVQLKFSYFLIDLEDEIVFDSTSITPSTPFGKNINIAKSRRTGIETYMRIQPVEELDAYASYTWTLAYVRETDAGGTLADGRALGQIPEHRWTMGMNVYPFKRFGEWLEGLRVGMYGVFTGKQHPTAYESASQSTLDATGGAGHLIKRYSVWDFILSYRWREKEFYFKINNMFNDHYYSRAISATSFGTSIYPPGTYTFVNPGAPREYVLGLEWEF